MRRLTGKTVSVIPDEHVVLLVCLERLEVSLTRIVEGIGRRILDYACAFVAEDHIASDAGLSTTSGDLLVGELRGNDLRRGLAAGQHQ